MNEDGYTLVEMLAALAILGLATAAMVGAVRSIGGLQTRASAAAGLAERDAALGGALELAFRGHGPFSSAGGEPLEGTAGAIAFRCGVNACRVRYESEPRPALELTTAEGKTRIAAPPGLAFRYLGSRTASDHWPPDNPTDWQRLNAIELSDLRADRPVALVRLWITGASDPAAAP